MNQSGWRTVHVLVWRIQSICIFMFLSMHCLYVCRKGTFTKQIYILHPLKYNAKLMWLYGGFSLSSFSGCFCWYLSPLTLAVKWFSVMDNVGLSIELVSLFRCQDLSVMFTWRNPIFIEIQSFNDWETLFPLKDQLSRQNPPSLLESLIPKTYFWSLHQMAYGNSWVMKPS